jgi:hypothetical protein
VKVKTPLILLLIVTNVLTLVPLYRIAQNLRQSVAAWEQCMALRDIADLQRQEAVKNLKNVLKGYSGAKDEAADYINKMENT